MEPPRARCRVLSAERQHGDPRAGSAVGLALVQAWNLIAWSGPLGVGAMLLFAINIIMTVRRQPSPRSAGQVPVQTVRRLVLEK